jgi:hypothetical protein
MHQGTLDPETLIPWINLLLKLINYSGTVNDKKIVTLKQAAQIYSMEPEFFDQMKKRILLTKTLPRGA